MRAGNEIVIISLGERSVRCPSVEAAGFGVETTADFPADTARAPRILVLDCDKQIDNGLTLLDRAKTVWPHVPVLFVTATSSEDIILRAWKGGAWEFFRHPVQRNHLEDTLKFLLEVTGCSSPAHLVPLPDPLQRSLKFIKDNLTRNLTLADLAATAALTPYHFSRKFRLAFGLPPMAYVRKERVARAEVFLRETSLPISQIAYRVGFNDYSDFIRQFRKITGVSPRSYRSAARESNTGTEKSNYSMASVSQSRTLASSGENDPPNKRLRRRVEPPLQ